MKQSAAAVPDFEQLLVNPDLSKEALKGLVLEYEKKRQKLEDDVTRYKREYARLKDEMIEVTMENRSFKDSVPSKLLQRQDDASIPCLKTKICQLTQERDTATSMWKMAEKYLKETKEELAILKSSNKLEILVREMNNMQRDYSDAITLLESKLIEKEREIDNLLLQTENFTQEVVNLKARIECLRGEIAKTEERLAKSEKAREESAEAMERVLNRVADASKSEEEAKRKLEETAELAAQALDAEKIAEEEVDRLTKLLEEERKRVNVDSEEVIELKIKLRDVIKERTEIIEDFEKVKLECYTKLHDVITKNKTLSSQIKECQERKFSDRIQWNEERKTLRLQIMTLQSSIEQVNNNLREQKYHIPCRKCVDSRRRVEKYKKIAARWKKRAEATNFIEESKDKSS